MCLVARSGDRGAVFGATAWLVVFVSGCGFANHEAATALAVSWPVDSTVTVGGYPAEPLGRPQVVSEQSDRVLCFDGQKDGLVVDINPLDAQTQFTVQALIKPQSNGNGQQQFLHFDDENAGRVLMETRLGTDNRWYLHTFANTSSGRAQLATAGALHRADEWHWAALTYANGTLRHFVDGKEEAAAELEFDPLKAGKMAIGSRLSGENWFKGCVRSLRLTNVALTADLLERDVSVAPAPQLRAQAGG